MKVYRMPNDNGPGFVPGLPIVGQSGLFDSDFLRAAINKNMYGGPGGYEYLAQKHFTPEPQPQPIENPAPVQQAPREIDFSVLDRMFPNNNPQPNPQVSPVVNDPQPLPGQNAPGTTTNDDDYLTRILGGYNPNQPAPQVNDQNVNVQQPNGQQPFDVNGFKAQIREACQTYNVDPTELLAFSSQITMNDLALLFKAKQEVERGGAQEPAPVSTQPQFQPPSQPQVPLPTNLAEQPAASSFPSGSVGFAPDPILRKWGNK